MLALALALQGAGRGLGIDGQGLLAQHWQPVLEGPLGPVQVRGRRAGDVDAAQPGMAQQVLGLIGNQQLRMPAAQGRPRLRVRVPGAQGMEAGMAVEPVQHSLAHDSQSDEANGVGFGHVEDSRKRAGV
ncbi:hypothetical protein ABDJ40_10955 [Roseateles sp. 2.12]|uniref:Uncharacterized protein n=1 Tax=Roseateles flavus TaxID=3149041 RepID=A0ABV0GDZ2_9BURK